MAYRKAVDQARMKIWEACGTELNSKGLARVFASGNNEALKKQGIILQPLIGDRWRFILEHENSPQIIEDHAVFEE